MDGLWQDLRLALRALWKSPLATGLAMTCLALGIGTNATMFSVVSGLLLNPLPFREPAQLLVVSATTPDGRRGRAGVSYLDLTDYQAQSGAFEALVGVQGRSLTFSDTDEPERVLGAAVSWRLFSMLGVVPALGRDFSADDDRAGAADVVMLSDELWRRRYNADPAIVGRAVTVNARPYTVIGVLPPRVKFPFLQTAWIPLAPLSGSVARESRDLEVFGRLAAGRTLAHAREDLSATATRLAAQHHVNAGWGMQAEPLVAYYIPSEVRLVTLTAMGAVTFVLLIACANVANLLLARATARAREMSIRAAIGAGRSRIVRQLLTESTVLGCASAPLGLGLAWVGISALRARVPADDVPYLIDFRLDPTTLAYTVAISVVTGLVFGLTPAFHAAKGNLVAALREGGRTGDGGVRNRARHTLVVAEVALSIVLLVGAALFARSFLNLQRADTGFDPAPLTTVRMFMPGAAVSGRGRDGPPRRRRDAPPRGDPRRPGRRRLEPHPARRRRRRERGRRRGHRGRGRPRTAPLLRRRDRALSRRAGRDGGAWPPLHRRRGRDAVGRGRDQRQHGPPPLRPARRQRRAAAGAQIVSPLPQSSAQSTRWAGVSACSTSRRPAGSRSSASSPT